MDNKNNVIKKFHPSPWHFFSFYFFGAIFIIAGFSFQLFWYLSLIGILVILLGEIARRAETFYILESGVAREYKLFSTTKDYADYKKIQNIGVDQSFLENILGIGKVSIDTAGSYKAEVVFSGVNNPYKVEKIILSKLS